MFFMFLLLVVNFVISWSNAASVGRFWSESKLLVALSGRKSWQAI